MVWTDCCCSLIDIGIAVIDDTRDVSIASIKRSNFSFKMNCFSFAAAAAAAVALSPCFVQMQINNIESL